MDQMEPMEFFRLFISSLPSLLLCGASVLPVLLPLVFLQNRRKNQISFLAPLAPLLERAGLKPAPFWMSVIRSVYYETPGGYFQFPCITKISAIFTQKFDRCVFILHPSRFLIFSPLFRDGINTILYDLLVYDRWHETTLDTRTRLNLQVICNRGNADRIRHRLEQPEPQQYFMLLRQNQQEYYILSQ